MPQDLESALAACEALLRQGASMEECLERFPEQRETLESLLRVYQVFRKSWEETPPPSREGLQRARTRFLSEAARLREAEEARHSGWSRLFQGLLSLSTSRGLAIAAYVLVFFTVAVTVTAVAQGALPGDPLYPVKRHSEDVALFLDRSEALRERVDQRRLDEVETLTERAPDQEITISGEVDRVEGLSFRVGGIPVQVPEEMRDRIPAEGTRVQVVGVPREDHLLLIEAPLIKATPRSTQQVIMAMPTATATPTVTTPPTETATATPTASATVTVTVTVTGMATALPTDTAVPAKVEISPATATSTVTETQTAIPTSTMTNTPVVPTETPTPQPPPRPITVRIEGCIEQLGAERWLVAGTWVRIPANRFSLERAAAVVGAGVMIRAIEKPDGRLEAESITVYAPQVREFNGAIQEIAQEYWRVAERTVYVDEATEIVGERIVGARAQVVADEYCNGRLQARRISIVMEPEILIGRILTVAGDYWVLERSDNRNQQRVSFNRNTEIHGKVVVGATVQVTAIKLADESLLARSIHVLAGPPPTRTPTPTHAPPTATPTPTRLPPTATPTPTRLPPTATPTLTEVPPTTTATPTEVPPTATATPKEVVVTVTPEPNGEQKKELIEPTPSRIPDTATAEPSVQPSSTNDIQEATADAISATYDQKTELKATIKRETRGDAIEISPTPALCPTPMAGS